ncbi:EMILIN-2 isoform X3 [Esox lucius]|uniref:EMILIN-2-like n=1 Tax=Esox lucius TaxID=8010 RepID=A0A3P8ZWF0_ESOLU|nr:EMILIN-2 isoform X3 [Esox lucius]
MNWGSAGIWLTWTIFSLLFIVSVTIEQNLPNYNLFQGTAYRSSGHRQSQRNRNWCAYVVHKNVSCTVQANAESWVDAEAAPCPTHDPDCEQQVMYRTRFRPAYKISYKTVTELQWRCCPSYQGPNCSELKTAANRPARTQAQNANSQTLPAKTQSQAQNHAASPHYPQTRSIPGQTRHTLSPERRETGGYERRHGGGVDRVRLLEGEVQRLSNTVGALQAAMTGLSSTLRTDLQEDTSKMIVTLLNNLRPRASDTELVDDHLGSIIDGHQATRGSVHVDRGLETVLARLDDVNTSLNKKGDALEELRGIVTSHSGQIRLLLDSSGQSHQGPEPNPNPAEAGAPVDLEEVLKKYIDGQLDTLRKKLEETMEKEVEKDLEKLQRSCEGRIESMERSCEEEHRRGLVSLTEMVDNKEAQLKKEIRELRLDIAASDQPGRTLRETDSMPSSRQTDMAGHGETSPGVLPAVQRGDLSDLWRELERVAEAHRVLNARMDNELQYLQSPHREIEGGTGTLEGEVGARWEELEARLNVTEQNAEVHCFYIEEKLTHALAEQGVELRQVLEERVKLLEDQFTTMLVELNNGSYHAGAWSSMDPLQAEVNNNKFLLQGLDEKVNAVAKLCASGCGVSNIEVPNPGGTFDSSLSLKVVDSMVKDLKLCRNDLDILHTDVSANSGKLKVLEEIIDRQLSGQHPSIQTVEDLQREMITLRDNMGGLRGTVMGLGDDMSRYTKDLTRINHTCCQARPGSLELGATRSPVEVVSKEEVEDMKTTLDSLTNQVQTELQRCSSVPHVEGRVLRLEKVCDQLDRVSAGVQGVKEGLERHVAGLWNHVSRVNTTLQRQAVDISALQGKLQTLHTRITDSNKHMETGVPVRPGSVPDQTRSRLNQIHIPVIIPIQPPPDPSRQPLPNHPSLRLPLQPRQPGNPSPPHLLPNRPTVYLMPNQPSQPNQHIITVVPHQPSPPSNQPHRVVEVGEAGPPGFMRRVTVRRGSENSAGTPVEGFAGPPGHVSPLKPVTFNKPEKIHKPEAIYKPETIHVSLDGSLQMDSFSFSAGLTHQLFSGEIGTIRFNKVLVNDGGHYNAVTGIFTVPMEGRYLISGILTVQQGEGLEAVLSVSSRSVQRLMSSCSEAWTGLGDGGAQERCPCGGSVSFSLILSLRKGDRVGLVRTAGQLATTESRDILSTFSAIFLYAPQTITR